jgi:hypothetical protein
MLSTLARRRIVTQSHHSSLPKVVVPTRPQPTQFSLRQSESVAEFEGRVSQAIDAKFSYPGVVDKSVSVADVNAKIHRIRLEYNSAGADQLKVYPSVQAALNVRSLIRKENLSEVDKLLQTHNSVGFSRAVSLVQMYDGYLTAISAKQSKLSTLGKKEVLEMFDTAAAHLLHQQTLNREQLQAYFDIVSKDLKEAETL